jgi:ligand-binding sensor domain-containing protein
MVKLIKPFTMKSSKRTKSYCAAILVVSLSLSNLTSFAQKVETFDKNSLNIHNALAIVDKIEEDNAGNIWFSYTLGVIVYSQGQFKTFDLDGEFIFFFDYQNQQKSVLTTKSIYFFKNNEIETTISRKDMDFIRIDGHQNIWLFNKKGIFKIEDKLIVMVAELPNITDVEFGENDCLYVFDKKKVYIFDEKTSKIKDESLIDKKEYSFWDLISDIWTKGEYVSSKFTDSQNRQWVITDKSVSYIDNNLFRRFDKQNGLNISDIKGIYEDRQKNIWIYGEKDIALFDNGNWNYFSKDDGLASGETIGFFEDKSDNLWLMKAGKICKYSSGKWLSLVYGSSDFIITNIFNSPSGNVMFTSFYTNGSIFSGGLFEIINDKIIKIKEAGKKPIFYIDFVAGNNMLAVGYKQILFNENKEWKTLFKVNSLVEEQIDMVFKDSKGNYWVGNTSKFNGIPLIIKISGL